MRRYLLILTLLFVAATPEETKLYRLAQAAFKDGIYDLAERQFAEFLKQFPESAQADGAQLLLGRAQLYQGKWQDAVTTLQGALTKFPEKRPDSFRFWLAEAYVRGEKYAEAESRYADLLETMPRSSYRPQALYGQAYAQFKQENYDAAAESLELLAKLAPKEEVGQEAELLRGQLDLARGALEPAEKIFAEVIAKYPDTRTAYRADIWFGESLARREQFEDALKHYATVIAAFKDKPNKPVDAQLAAEAWNGEGWVFWKQGKFTEAAEAFSLAFTNAQSRQLKRDALLKLGEASVRAGKLADGVAKLKSFLQTNPADPLAEEVQLAIGNLLMGSDDFKAALPEFVSFITKFPKSALLAKANMNAGWCAWKLNQTAEALSYFKQAFALASDAAGENKDPALASEALFKVGDAQYALGEYADAINSYQRLISSAPGNKLLDRAMFQLGQSYQRTRNAEAASHTFGSLIEQFPASDYAPEAQFNIGVINVGLGKEEEARAAFRDVVSKFPQSDWAQRAALAVGESFYREAKYDEAAAEFDKLIQAAPQSELGQRAFYNRGWCYFAKGQPDKTLAEFSEFLKKYPESPLAPDVQFWIADYYMKQKDFIKAQEQFQLLAKTYATSKLADSAQYMAGRAAYLRQDYKTAIELYEALIKGFPESSWRCDARFGEGDALSELGQFEDALIVFDSLLTQFPDCYLLCDAQGRKADCLFTLNRYDDAVLSYRKALDCARELDPAIRNQLYYKLGQSYEKAGKLTDAFEWYSKAVYEQSETPDPSAPPERFWMCKAGLAAGAVKEQQQAWRDAITLYERVAGLCADMKPLLEERIRKIRVEHLILF